MGNEIKDVKRVNVPLEANFLTSTILGQWAFCADTKRVLGHNLLAATIDFGVSDDSLQLLISSAQDVLGKKTFKTDQVLFGSNKLWLGDDGGGGGNLSWDGSNSLLHADAGGKVVLTTDSGDVELSPGGAVTLKAGVTENTSYVDLRVTGTNKLYLNTTAKSFIQNDGFFMFVDAGPTEPLQLSANGAQLTLGGAENTAHRSIHMEGLNKWKWGDTTETYGGELYSDGTNNWLNTYSGQLYIDTRSAGDIWLMPADKIYLSHPSEAAQGYLELDLTTKALSLINNTAGYPASSITLQSTNSNVYITAGTGEIYFEATGNQSVTINAGGLTLTAAKHVEYTNGPTISSGTLTPEGQIAAPVGSIFLRDDNANAFYVKQTGGSGNTGWVLK